MNLTINEKEYDLRFGIKFIEQLDNVYRQEVEGGISFGMGTEMAIPYLNMGRPTAAQEVIFAALSHANNRPSKAVIEAFLYELAEKDDEYNNLLDELMEGMDQSPFLKQMKKRRERTQEK